MLKGKDRRFGKMYTLFKVFLDSFLQTLEKALHTNASISYFYAVFCPCFSEHLFISFFSKQITPC
jgi:hypothetical protein